jgi:hypothetical protein
MGTLCLVNYRSTVLLNFYRFGQRYVVFFCCLKYVFELVHKILHQILTIVMFLDTENGKMVSSIWVAIFCRAFRCLSHKLSLVIEREVT